MEALVQLAKVRTEQLRYEAAKANKYPVRITQEPMKLLNQAGEPIKSLLIHAPRVNKKKLISSFFFHSAQSG